MSKNKGAKTASKNNPTSRTGARKYFLHGKEVKPVKIIEAKNIMAAVYVDSDQIIKDSLEKIMPWRSVAKLCS